MGAITESTTHAVRRSEADTQGRAGLETAQYLTFMLSGEIYALEILNIKEIIQYGDLTEVPMMPAFIRGVINLRGKVVPVVDMNARFGRGITSIARRTSIVIIEFNDDEEAGSHSIGVMVDAVNEVIDIARQDIEPPPAFGARIRPDFVNGMAKHNGRFIIVLNLTQVLSVAEMSALGSAMLGGAQAENLTEPEYER